MSRKALALTLVAAFGFTGCDDPGAQPTALEGETLSPSAARVGAPAPGDSPIAAIAIDAGFTQLVSALAYVDAELEAGLVDVFLNGKNQYTVFAPTDEAFHSLYGLLSTVLGADIDEITDVPAEIVLDVLLYHVTAGRRGANSVVPKRVERTITTLLGETFAVRTDLSIEDGLTGLRDDASIVSADISASNGIIHVISGVIVPPSVVAALTS
jgi:uncharacterized surface protein with fasciclin (FAS1) repeats